MKKKTNKTKNGKIIETVKISETSQRANLEKIVSLVIIANIIIAFLYRNS